MSKIEAELKTSEKKSGHGIFEDFLDNIVIFENK
jgi:DNA helicase TIP49 (TBP-interacting protein)